MTTQNLATPLGEGRDAAPSLAHPSQKPNPVVYTEELTHLWAGHSIAQSEWARVFYQQQRHKGKGHHAAVRALAFKWIRVVFRCWKDGVAYDESQYLATLAKRGSPLSAIVAPAPAKTM
jgi:hypothetical protein